MEVSVREMREKDIPQVAKIEKELFTDPWSEKSLQESFAQENVKMIVAETAINHIVGYHIFYTSLEEGDVARVAVAPTYRRAGIGSKLLDYIWEYCQQIGIERVLLEVRESNAYAIALYQKHGFISLGLRKNYYIKPLEDGVIMEKRLDITTSNSNWC